MPGDTNLEDDVFVKDLADGTTARMSTDGVGNQADGSSRGANTSGDGRFVAFHSNASNLVSNDGNATFDIFVKDRVSGAVVRASTDSAGNEANSYSYDPVISGDGRYVAFRTYATNLVPGDTNEKADILVKDLWSGATVRASSDSEGNQANADCYRASISDDGRYVGFDSPATNLVPGDANGRGDAFLKDLWSGTMTMVDTNSQGVQADGGGGNPSLSADGRYVSFGSNASNLVPNDTNEAGDLFVKDLADGAIVRVNLTNSGGQANQGGGDSAISADGRRVAFSSSATNLHPAASTYTENIYRVWSPLFAPDMTLHGSSVAENQAVGTSLGAFMAGANPSGEFTYSLVAGEGDADNGSFTIEGSQLKTAAIFDFETKSAYSIRVQATDGGSVTVEKTFAISVTDVHDFASPGLFDSASSAFYLRNSNSTGAADYSFGYGDPSLDWTKLVGDWDGDGADSVGFFDPASATWYLRNALSAGFADYAFGCGDPTLTTGHGDRNWLPLVGDWDGNGTDTIGFFDPVNCAWHLRNALSAGFADYTFAYGDPSLTTGHGDRNWSTIVGDWDGNGSTTIGFFDPANCAWYLRNALSTGFADYTFAFGDVARTVGHGASNWTPVVGDWDGNRTATIGFFDPAASGFMLRNSLTTGAADVSFGYGSPGAGWEPLTGCWYTGAEQAKLDPELSLSAAAVDLVHLELW